MKFLLKVLLFVGLLLVSKYAKKELFASDQPQPAYPVVTQHTADAGVKKTGMNAPATATSPARFN